MEKRSAHYDLDDIKDVVARLGIRAFTRSSIDGGAEMGLASREMIAVVLGVGCRAWHVLQEHDHLSGPQGLAGRVPRANKSGTGLCEVYVAQQRFCRDFLQETLERWQTNILACIAKPAR